MVRWGWGRRGMEGMMASAGRGSNGGRLGLDGRELRWREVCRMVARKFSI